MDETIQALERAQGYLKLANGRALIGHSHDYKRNGTTALFAAFEVATGKARAEHKSGRRRRRVRDHFYPGFVRPGFFPSCEAGLAASRWGSLAQSAGAQRIRTLPEAGRVGVHLHLLREEHASATTRAFAVDVGDKSRPIIASGGSGCLTDMSGYEFGGYRCPVGGHAFMDLLPIDVSDLPDPTAARYGEMVTLIGGEIGIDDVAAATRSTGRGVLTHLRSRFHRIHTPSDQFER